MTSTIVSMLLSPQNVLLRKPARMRVAHSTTAGFLSKKPISSCRSTERQELAHKCAQPIVDCPEPETVDQEWELPFLCGLGTGVLLSCPLELRAHQEGVIFHIFEMFRPSWRSWKI